MWSTQKAQAILSCCVPPKLSDSILECWHLFMIMICLKFGRCYCTSRSITQFLYIAFSKALSIFFYKVCGAMFSKYETYSFSELVAYLIFWTDFVSECRQFTPFFFCEWQARYPPASHTFQHLQLEMKSLQKWNPPLQRLNRCHRFPRCRYPHCPWCGPHQLESL